jgi:PEP-CTERM motif
MSRNFVVLTRLTVAHLTCAVTLFGLNCATIYAASTVVSDNYESYPPGTFGTVSDFSDASYGGANASASIVAGQALQFAFDVKTGMGALNTNVSAPFPAPAANNSSADLANYTLEFDLSVLSGITTGWFGVVEVATPGSGPRTQGLNLGALTVGGPSEHQSMTLSAMGQPFGNVIDPTNPSWQVHLVALGFPANGGGGTVRTTLLLDNVKVTSVPEPNTFVLLGTASAGALWVVRRRENRGVNSDATDQ